MDFFFVEDEAIQFFFMKQKCAEPIRLQTHGVQRFRRWMSHIFHRHVAELFAFVPRIVLLAAEHR